MPIGFAIEGEVHPDIKLPLIKAGKGEKQIIESLSNIRFLSRTILNFKSSSKLKTVTDLFF